MEIIVIVASLMLYRCDDILSFVIVAPTCCRRRCLVSMPRWLFIVISYYCAIIRTYNYDRVITAVKCDDATSQANFAIVPRSTAIRRQWRSEWITLRYAYVSLARCYSRYCGCNSRRSEYDAVPDETKIKDDVTESWSLFILRQHHCLSPRSSVSFLTPPRVELDTRIVRNNKMGNNLLLCEIWLEYFMCSS